MARDGFLLERRNWRNLLGGDFFLRGAKNGLGFAKLFSGDLDFRKTETDFVCAFCPRGGGVWGGIRAGFLSDFSVAANIIKEFL